MLSEGSDPLAMVAANRRDAQSGVQTLVDDVTVGLTAVVRVASVVDVVSAEVVDVCRSGGLMVRSNGFVVSCCSSLSGVDSVDRVVERCAESADC
jgi:hypothetical protein